MREEQHSSDDAQKRENITPASCCQSTCANSPLEDGEPNHEQCRQPMHQHFGCCQGIPESFIPKRPAVRLPKNKKKEGKRQEEKRPVASPTCSGESVDEGSQCNDDDEDTGDVVVEIALYFLQRCR